MHERMAAGSYNNNERNINFRQLAICEENEEVLLTLVFW